MNNSLAMVHPELIAEWSEKNLPLTPDTVTYGSNKVMWWKGACGHEWQSSIKSRSAGEKCPICSGARVVEGINDLATLKPELAKEWSDKNKELKSTTVTVGSNKKVIWKGTCGHEWTASVKSRTVNGTGWDFIMFMWGLEVHILKQQSNMEEANKIIQQMDSLWLYPPKLPAVVPEYEKARRDRFTLLSCSREKEISNASSRVRANDWRFIALFKLIGYGSTGLFPNLEKDKTAVEMIIKDYIQTLRQGK